MLTTRIPAVAARPIGASGIGMEARWVALARTMPAYARALNSPVTVTARGAAQTGTAAAAAPPAGMAANAPSDHAAARHGGRRPPHGVTRPSVVRAAITPATGMPAQKTSETGITSVAATH